MTDQLPPPFSTFRPTGFREAELARLNSYWRAANYLAVGQIYLLDNALVREALRPEHTKPRLMGHWGTSPGLNFIYAHLSRVIAERHTDAIFVCGPGHGGPAVVANAWLEGTYSERYPHISRDAVGMNRLFRQFSFPGGIPSHVAPETPGSIHEGGELGYSLSHAFGAAFDNSDLVVACVVGDGEAETGPAATGWHSNKFLDPVHDGAVLPVLHLNGYKISAPAILARIPTDELMSLFGGYGYHPLLVEGGFDGEDPMEVHQRMAVALDYCFDRIAEIQATARQGARGDRGTPEDRAAWPMVILRTPKGWTGPKFVDGLAVEGTFRSHQVPLAEVRTNPAHLAQLEEWLHSYHPEELFDERGRPVSEINDFAPVDDRRMSMGEATRVLGTWLRDVIAANPTNFKIFGPDETVSNRLQDVFDVTDRVWEAQVVTNDDHLARSGRVLEMLSEHQCQGWLEGYLLTGRHGLFNCYEAFIHIVDSMLNQHAKWLKVSAEVEWRAPVASLNYLLTSHVWRQDHNGFSHQDPGFLDHVVTKKAAVARVYLPPDTNCLLSVADHCLRSRDYVNVIVAGKQPQHNWLSVADAVDHCTRGVGIWSFASNDQGEEPDVVMACCGDIPTLETMAAVQILGARLPDLKVRVVNVVDLMRLESSSEHPHGLSDVEFDTIFTARQPVVFAFPGYPALIHRLTYRRTNHGNFHVHGYREEGTTTTPFDMVMLNDLDRFRFVIDVLDRVAELGERSASLRQEMIDARLDARSYTCEHGEDPPEISAWMWTLTGPGPTAPRRETDHAL